MSRLAVTGAGGFIGAHLTRALLAEGHEVVAIDNYIRGQASRLASAQGAIERVTLDVRDKDALVEALRGVECVFHLAAVNGTENFYTQPQLVLDVGVRGALAVSEACIEAGVPDLVVASSAEVYQTPRVVPTDETIEMVIPDSLNPRYSYGGSKLISELIAFNYCRDKLRKVQVFRPHNIYGPDMGWKHVVPQLIEKIVAAGDGGSITLQGDGSETRAFCYVSDVVDGIVRMWRDGESMNVYHIGSMEEVAIRDLARITAEALGTRVELIAGPAAAGATPRRCPDIGKMQAIGYAPSVSLVQGIERTVAWYRENPAPTDSNPLL
ncbi:MULTISPECIES: NAD-dependent epimerase/dehydratase family protein [Methylorubrum]|jgi:UDP-glucose 4-epimerase|uniref:NAD-dependent epimerase/dehydratase family protein n=1 Tax=Methylorubrum TaxID=2282523 RepID=UPI001075DBD6|nr:MULTISPECIES: NAD-dependent epimerase/dehydratase family protein [Methylorubrum]MCP1539127.1 UDP-glucose 4-epimerase [Methylorubrum extorquens]TFZ58401.1 NAD-dependent epimerase/dehydratase family protein [Methylorubrum sp. Q1]UYW26022.1 NAD-dependent epimerase/dehydratase family protein [Methylorubrum extorquens]UYW34171.1 NAD-dependent epimerase/dehydratase family protein [Methylorubrum extorquens]